jgi:hypothetical protein
MRGQRSIAGLWRPLLAGAVLVAGPFLLAACYTYVPVVGETPSPGEQVRVQLSQDQAVRLSERTGHTIRRLEGRVFRAEPDSLTLDVGWGAVYAGTMFEGRRDTLSFHRGDLLEVDRRELSRGRTALVSAGFVALVTTIVLGITGGADTGEPGNGNGTTPF